MTILQRIVDELIDHISTTDQAGTVSNKQVGQIFAFLNNDQKEKQEIINSALNEATEANTKIQQVTASLSDFKSSKGEPDGIAPLNQNGKVSKSFLPDELFLPDEDNGILVFDGFGTRQGDELNQYIGQPGTQRILFDSSRGIFFMRLSQSVSSPYQDFSNWWECESFGQLVEECGIKPQPGRIYITADGVYIGREGSTPDNSEAIAHLEKRLSGVSYDNIADVCMDSSKAVTVATDALKESGALRSSDKRQVVNVGMLRDTLASFAAGLVIGDVTVADGVPIPDSEIIDMLDEID